MNTRRIALLLGAICFSLNVSAAVGIDCEILLQTSYGRMLHMLAEKSLITQDELNHVRLSRKPINPYFNRPRNETSHAIKEGFDRVLRLPETRRNWKQIRQVVEEIINSANATEVLVHDVKVNTEKVLNPKLIATVPFGTPAKAQFTYNPVTNSIVLWNTNSRGGEVISYDLKSQKTVNTKHPYELSGLVRKNGEVWIAGVDDDGVKVFKWPSETPHVWIKLVGGADTKLYEMPTGEVYLALITHKNIDLYDVSKRNKAVEIPSSSSWGNFSPPVFHLSKTGEQFVAVISDSNTEIKKLVKGKFQHFGYTTTGYRSGRKVILESDSKGNLYVGEELGTQATYHVVQFGSKGADKLIWSTDESLQNYRFPAFHIDKQDQLTLAITFDENPSELNLIQLSQPKHPRIKVQMPKDSVVEPAWVTLPNGIDAMIVAPDSEKVQIYSVADGSLLGTVDAATAYEFPPTVHQLPDGRVILAVESFMREIRVFDLWTSSVRDEEGSR